MPCTCRYFQWLAPLASQDFLFRRTRELFIQIKWVVLARAVFALVLIFSTLFFSDTGLTGQRDQSFLSLYKISGTILGLSLAYFAWLCTKKYLYTLAYTQIIIDTVRVPRGMVYPNVGCVTLLFEIHFYIPRRQDRSSPGEGLQRQCQGQCRCRDRLLPGHTRSHRVGMLLGSHHIQAHRHTRSHWGRIHIYSYFFYYSIFVGLFFNYGQMKRYRLGSYKSSPAFPLQWGH